MKFREHRNHNVTNSKKASQEDDLYVHIDDFRKQLDYIVGNGYNVKFFIAIFNDK